MGKKQSFLKSSAPYFVGIVVLATAGGLTFWLARKPGPHSQPQAPPAQQSPLPHLAAKERRKVNIYVMQKVNDDVRLVPQARTIPPNVDPHKAAIEKLLITNREAGPSQYLIPVGTKLLGLEIKDRIAYANFSREIKDNFSGGSMSEALLLNSIVHTLTQFNDVDKVQILIEGKKIESLGGHLDISQPLTGDSALVGEDNEE
jgi:spore germination protein GerM